MKIKTVISNKKDSTLLKEILQILSSLVILGYITLYFFDLTDRETVALDFSFYKHLFLISLLITGLIVSFKNTLIAGFIYLLFCTIVAESIFIGNYDLANVSNLLLDLVVSVVLLIMGILFIFNFIKKSKRD